MLRVCSKCGSFFSSIRSNHCLCKKCSYTYFSVVPNKTRACAFCGKTFKITTKNQKFCCDKCRAEYHSKKVFEEHECAFCKTVFLRSTKKKEYCSEECYRSAKKERDADRRSKE